MAPVRHFVSCTVIVLIGLLKITSAAILYEGATIIAFNDSKQSLNVLENASILIEDNVITELGQITNLTSIPSNTTRIDAMGKIISPGFIDAYVPIPANTFAHSY